MRHKNSLPQKMLYSTMIACASFWLASCSSVGDQQSVGRVSDPWEASNRAIFEFNSVLDDAIGKPVAKTYRTVFPEPARLGARNVLRNLATPVNAGNQLLQGDIGGVANDLGRVIINTTLGIGGLFDVAGVMGLEYEPEDFGQTLSVWGLSSGPYIVIPVLGPSNVRDSVGRLTDSMADPLNHYLFNTEQEEYYYLRAGVSIIDQRESVLDVLEEMEASSIDYYAVMRSSYTQYRNDQIRDQDEDHRSYVEILDYDEE